MSKAKVPMAGLCFKVTAEYWAWVSRLAQHSRRTLADTVDGGLVLLARETGFAEPPPPRVTFPSRAGRKVRPATDQETQP